MEFLIPRRGRERKKRGVSFSFFLAMTTTMTSVPPCELAFARPIGGGGGRWKEEEDDDGGLGDCFASSQDFLSALSFSVSPFFLYGW